MIVAPATSWEYKYMLQFVGWGTSHRLVDWFFYVDWPSYLYVKIAPQDYRHDQWLLDFYTLELANPRLSKHCTKFHFNRQEFDTFRTILHSLPDSDFTWAPQIQECFK